MNDIMRLREVRERIRTERRHATDVIIMPTPETMPTGWAVTRLVVEDIWDLFVKPTQDAGGFEGPEVRALAAILKELYAALPEHSEPRRYKPTIERTEA